MRVVCPSCHAAYDVPNRLLGGAPRRLHCNRCGHEWVVDPAELEAANAAREIVVAGPPPPTADRPIPVLQPGNEERRASRTALADRDTSRGGRAGTAFGWTLTAVLLIALGYFAYARRDAVMTAWPASERLYMALGLR